MNSHKLKNMLTFLFCLWVVAVPWMLGGNLPPVRFVGLAIVSFLAALLLLFPKNLGTPTGFGSTLKLLLIFGTGYAAFQLVPQSSLTYSEYAPATRARLCELLLGVGSFFVASHLFNRPKALPWVFGVIAINGVMLTFLGLAQAVSNSDKIYWAYELIHGGQPFGPFVNGNNSGGYLLMCFAAANFFLARRVFQAQRPETDESMSLDRPHGKKNDRFEAVCGPLALPLRDWKLSSYTSSQVLERS